MKNSYTYKNQRLIVTLNSVDIISKRKMENQIISLIEEDCHEIRFNLKNFSSDDMNRVDRLLNHIKEIENEKDYQFKIYFDIPYPKKKYRFLSKHNHQIGEGDIITVLSDANVNEMDKIYIDQNFFKNINNMGSKFYYGDGEGKFELVDTNEECISFRALNEFELIHEKSISTAYMACNQLNNTQIQYLENKIRNNNVCGLFLSFCESSKELDEFRKYFSEELINSIDIYAKIETEMAVDNLLDILNACDGVMIARGDLALHCELKNFLYIQNKIARMVKEAGKKLYFATDILNSLISQYVPERSDIIDFLNMIQYEPDAIILKAVFFSKKRVKYVKKFLENLSTE